MTTSLIVHNVDESMALRLKRRADANGRTAEAEHREILKDALQKPRRRSFFDVLASMPNVGKDDDFEVRSAQG
ncbi:MAG: DNA-binding protein [Duganella sp.]